MARSKEVIELPCPGQVTFKDIEVGEFFVEVQEPKIPLIKVGPNHLMEIKTGYVRSAVEEYEKVYQVEVKIQWRLA